MIYSLKKTNEKNSNSGSEQNRKAQSALTAAPKETKYNNAKQPIKFSKYHL